MIKNLKYINIEYTDNDLEYIDYICYEIERKTEEIVNFFEINDFNEKVNIKLFDGIDNFRNFYKETFKRDAKDYICGFSKNNNVYTLSLDEYKKCYSHENSTIEDLIKLILHEFTHSVHSKRNSNMNVIWLNEGAATYLSDQHKDIKKIKGTLDDLINGKCTYSDYKLMFEYALNTYGSEYILNLIDNEELANKETEKIYKEAIIKYNIKVYDLETDRLILKVPTMEEQYDLWNILKEEKVNRYYMPIPSRFKEYYEAKTNSLEDRKIRLQQRKLFQEKLQDWDKQKVFYQKKINHLDDNQSKFSWSIFLKTGEVIGQITVQPNGNSEDDPSIRDIGWFINPKYQGNGYATEAATKVLEYMFNEAQIDEIITSAAKCNSASWKLMEKLGFIRTGEKIGTYINDEGFLLLVYTYDLTKEIYLNKINNKFNM